MATIFEIPPMVKCPRPVCGHEWMPRVPAPLTCPRCKQYLPQPQEDQTETAGAKA